MSLNYASLVCGSIFNPIDISILIEAGYHPNRLNGMIKVSPHQEVHYTGRQMMVRVMRIVPGIPVSGIPHLVKNTRVCFTERYIEWGSGSWLVYQNIF